MNRNIGSKASQNRNNYHSLEAETTHTSPQPFVAVLATCMVALAGCFGYLYHEQQNITSQVNGITKTMMAQEEKTSLNQTDKENTITSMQKQIIGFTNQQKTAKAGTILLPQLKVPICTVQAKGNLT